MTNVLGAMYMSMLHSRCKGYTYDWKTEDLTVTVTAKLLFLHQ